MLYWLKFQPFLILSGFFFFRTCLTMQFCFEIPTTNVEIIKTTVLFFWFNTINKKGDPLACIGYRSTMSNPTKHLHTVIQSYQNEYLWLNGTYSVLTGTFFVWSLENYTFYPIYLFITSIFVKKNI